MPGRGHHAPARSSPADGTRSSSTARGRGAARGRGGVRDGPGTRSSAASGASAQGGGSADTPPASLDQCLASALARERRARTEFMNIFAPVSTAQTRTPTMKETFTAAVERKYGQGTAFERFITEMWPIPFQAKCGAKEIRDLLKDMGIPHSKVTALTQRYLKAAAQDRARSKGTSKKSRNAARTFWLQVWLRLAGRCVYSKIYRTCQGSDFAGMSMARLERVGGSEHGDGEKDGGATDIRRTPGAWTGKHGKELGRMYPCCNSCNRRAHKDGIRGPTIAKFKALQRAQVAVKDLRRSIQSAGKVRALAGRRRR